jgi:hypothetical protein
LKGEATVLASVADLELRSLESMTRAELLAILDGRPELFSPALSGEWLSRQPTPSLHMLAVAAKLIEVVWRMDRRVAA